MKGTEGYAFPVSQLPVMCVACPLYQLTKLSPELGLQLKSRSL